MEPAGQRPDPLGQGGLEVEVDVLEGRVPGDRARRHLGPQALQSGHDRGRLVGAQQAGPGQAVDVGDRTHEIVIGERRIELDRAGEVGQALVARLPEAAAPELHQPSRVGAP